MSTPSCIWIGPLPGMPAELADPTPAPRRRVGAELTLDAAWEVLGEVLDPEVPAVSVVDLGIVREVGWLDAPAGHRRGSPPGLKIAQTPTYSGCPATEAISASVRQALMDSGFDPVTIELRRAPAWTTDWITARGRQRLREAGIAPPPARADEAAGSTGALMARPLRRMPRPPRLRPVPTLALSDANATAVTPPPCPRCQSAGTECLSAFGSTACKALYRCLSCREPFEFFKPL